MNAERVGNALAAGVLAAWFWGTVAANHPSRLFDRGRAIDRIGLLLPSRRYFAPTPVTHDVELHYQLYTAEGAEPAWRVAYRPGDRSARQAVWFPDRRRDKAVSDLAVELLRASRTTPRHGLIALLPYRVLSGLVLATAVEQETAQTAVALRFAVARSTGYGGGPPRYAFVSPLIAWPGGSPGAGPTPRG